MRLETLANELLLELFEYLDVIERFRAFHGLNSRFSTLLLSHFRTYRVDFHSVIKYRSDIICKQYFPSIIDRITSLRLSDNVEESGSQTAFFFSSGLMLNQFIHVRSLALCYIKSDDTMRKLIADCQQLPYLTHLGVIRCVFYYSHGPNSIWNLPKLTHCRLDEINMHFNELTIVSSTLEYVSISYQSLETREVAVILQKTPNLRFLQTRVRDRRPNHQNLPSFLPLTSLNVSDISSTDTMMHILQALPNLTHLKVDTLYIDCDGYRWEELIENYLPRLKVFRLRMCIDFFGRTNNDEHVDKLLDSFRTRFWLEKYQWYVRCHHRTQTHYKHIILYTLPYGFADLHDFTLTMPYKTTCPRDNNYDVYDRVKNISSTSSLSSYCISLLHFPNIRNLSIILCFDKILWKNIPVFYHLASITILRTNIDAQFHLQELLDRAPCLYALTIESWPLSEIPVVNNTNKSVRRLDLRINNSKNRYLSSTDVCVTFICSPLATQCEELIIKIEKCENIIDLVLGMPNLRILQIEYSFGSPLPNHKAYELNKKTTIQWLQAHLPPTCIIVSYLLNESKIWINVEKP